MYTINTLLSIIAIVTGLMLVLNSYPALDILMCIGGISSCYLGFDKLYRLTEEDK